MAGGALLLGIPVYRSQRNKMTQPGNKMTQPGEAPPYR